MKNFKCSRRSFLGLLGLSTAATTLVAKASKPKSSPKLSLCYEDPAYPIEEELESVPLDEAIGVDLSDSAKALAEAVDREVLEACSIPEPIYGDAIIALYDETCREMEKSNVPLSQRIFVVPADLYNALEDAGCFEPGKRKRSNYGEVPVTWRGCPSVRWVIGEEGECSVGGKR